MVGEGEGWTDLVVTLSAPSASVVSVRYRSVSGGNATGNCCGGPGIDYLQLSADTLTFAPGERTKTIRTQILDDLNDEAVESFVVFLDSEQHATIAKDTATVRIRDND